RVRHEVRLLRAVLRVTTQELRGLADRQRGIDDPVVPVPLRAARLGMAGAVDRRLWKRALVQPLQPVIAFYDQLAAQARSVVDHGGEANLIPQALLAVQDHSLPRRAVPFRLITILHAL